MTKKKWINLIVILFAFFGFVYIMSTIPFCSDDWAWGASVGAQISWKLAHFTFD